MVDCLHERPRRICEPLRIRLTSLRLIRLTPRVFSALNFELLRNLSLGSMSTFLGDLTGMLAGSGRGWTDDLLSRCPPSPRRTVRGRKLHMVWRAVHIFHQLFVIKRKRKIGNRSFKILASSVSHKSANMPKVVIVSTSADDLGGHPT